MLIKNGYFILDSAAGDAAWSDNGIWDGNEFIDTSKDEWEDRDSRDPYAVVKSSRLRDYFYAAPYRCVSEKAHAIITAGLKIWPGIRWTKVRILNRRKHHLANYWWLRCNIFGGLKALDLQHAKYTIYAPHQVVQPGTIVIDEVKKWVLDTRIIDGLDWFYGDKINWFVSPKAKKLIDDNQLSGFMFTPVDVWNYAK